MNALEKVLSLITPSTKVIAIDGRSASGKTTFSCSLAERIGGSVIHMDDFFLPPELRSEERYREAGGNVHYERFKEEVLDNLSSSQPFSYRRFNCSLMSYDEDPIIVDPAFPVIIEGAYSLSPAFGHYYDLSVFCDVDGSVQMRRIIARNGKEKAEVFRTRWIPMEELYISSCAIMEKADRIIRCCQEMGGSIPS